MVAQFLRLKLRLLGNIFRRSPWQVVGISLGLVYGVGLAALLFMTLVGLRFVGDVELIRDVFIVAGSATVVGFIVLPLLFGVDDTMDPRRFALFGLPDRTLALGLGVAAMIGIPALALAIVLAGTVVTWSRGVGETILAILAAAVAFGTCLLLARVATGLASVLLATRRAREVSSVLGVLLIVLLSPVIVVLATLDWANSGLRVLETIAGVLGWTPFGAAFAAPGDAAAGDWGPAILKFGVAVLTLGAVWFAWQSLVARMLVTPGREASAKSYRGLGWFDRMPHTATGAVAARSLTYWFRDARYWVSIIMVPIVPMLVIVPLGIAGIPLTYTALIPVPLMCLLLGWSLHNDTAYDSTAVWLHVVSERARHGRPGGPTRAGAHRGRARHRARQRGHGVRARRLAAAALDRRREHRPAPRRARRGLDHVGEVPVPGGEARRQPVPAAAVDRHGHGARAVDHDVRLAPRRRPGHLRSRRSGSSTTRRGTRPPSPRASGSGSWCSPAASRWAVACSIAVGPRSWARHCAPDRGRASQAASARPAGVAASARRIERMIEPARASIADPDAPGGGTSVLDRELEKLLEEEAIEPGDHERFSHYVKKEQILESAITGKPVKALCGKKWTPGRDPEKFPVCPTCREIYERMKAE